ncbi:MAG: hypothetical protein DRO11_00765 [Methanobacteriota archaeon]|nr:MAG: hypothetical protein DRO11_00765 [Euryarchaeota archaeon]
MVKEMVKGLLAPPKQLVDVWKGTKHVKHPFLVPGKVLYRKFQLKTARDILSQKKDVYVIAKTGLGKTYIGLMVAAETLARFPNSKIVIVCPTVGIAVQTQSLYRECLRIPPNKVLVVTGEDKPEKRVMIYRNRPPLVLCTTPQCLSNDIKSKRVTLRGVYLLIVDEVHHATTNRNRPAKPYNPIFKHYNRVRPANSLVIGFTASPGPDKKKILQLTKHTGLEPVLIDPEDPSVKKHINKVTYRYIAIKDEKVLEAYRLISQIKTNVLGVKMTFARAEERRRELETLKGKRQLSKQEEALLRKLLSVCSLLHLRQGLMHDPYTFRTRLRSFERAAKKGEKKTRIGRKKIINSIEFKTLKELSKQIKPKKFELIASELKQNPSLRCIIFVNARPAARYLTNYLIKQGIKTARLVGKSKVETISQKVDRGMNRFEQVRTINSFRRGRFRVLVGTNVLNEGLSLQEAERAYLIGFNSSERELIQREGRIRGGEIIVPVIRNSPEIGAIVRAHRKRKAMLTILRRQERELADVLNS